MRALLTSGQYIKGSRYTYRIGDFLGSGAQGEVYKATANGSTYAIKWYFPHMATDEQYNILKNLVAIGSPDRLFLWPTELITSPQLKGFGYIMPIRKTHYKSIIDLMKRRAEPNFSTLITASIQLVNGFRYLHQKGLCYRDISFGNLFFDDRTGDVLICDNDNITFEQSASKNILGTPRFMAPEIVTGERYPDIKSDLFSLSILLFYMFMIHHPLEGKLESNIKCFDLPAMKKLYGTHPVFIFDPMNRTNRPVKGFHDNAAIFWSLYPQFFKDAFITSFTAGLKDRNKRLGEDTWIDTLVHLSNSILYCQCGAENFYDIAKMNKDGIHQKCWSCQRHLSVPPRIKVGHYIAMLNNNCTLYSHQLDGSKKINFKRQLASVVKHPTKREVWGLKNMDSKPWQLLLPSGRAQQLEPYKSVVIEKGLHIDFGTFKGIVKK